MAINIHGIPNAGVGYSLVGKKIMVHDTAAPLSSSTVLVNASAFAAGEESGASAGGYAAPMWIVDGNPGSPEDGEVAFSHASLEGATEINFIIVNKIIEYIDDDYTFDIVTGTITRTNPFFTGDKMVTPHKPGL
jgi:hypothetical protein